MTVDQLQKYLTERKSKRLLVPKICCRDGFIFSVQASEFHYCSPKQNYYPWDTVEVGYPTPYDELLEPWHDIDQVYAFVPVDVVCEIIQKHGGVDLSWDYYNIS